MTHCNFSKRKTLKLRAISYRTKLAELPGGNACLRLLSSSKPASSSSPTGPRGETMAMTTVVVANAEGGATPRVLTPQPPPTAAIK